jgi:alkylation response protein AidB-like acyl-CoA dehydrogenase
MNNYQPKTEEVNAILFGVVKAHEQLAELPVFAETDQDLMGQVLEEAGKFVGEVVAPLHRVGDEEGCHFKDGVVTMPAGFKEAYEAFWQNGWGGLSAAEEDGGQGLPSVLDAVQYEWLSAANHGWTMAPGLLHGAYECIKHYASDDLKAKYLSKVATGEWLATMNLTEPHAGSDLGLARTKAVPQADGSYSITGTKIFISGGEHDMTDNIVHLVLARLPDAPPGPKGLSLFLVPKFYEDGKRSAAVCERIEEKMGIHGSPTCVMRFDEATGWIVGEPGKGLNAMFVMMNAARLHVALQGIGLLDHAWQKAHAYAQERRQMRAPGGSAKAGEADFIIAHPAMQRILDTQRAWIDGLRVLAYQTGVELDIIKHHPDAARKQAAQVWCAMLTPVLKASATDQGFHGASECLQVFGGHGYVSEWGIEQIVRDARIAMIYEGTNEIQAIDLLIRKTLSDGGTQLKALLDRLRSSVNATAQAGLLQRMDQLEALATRLAQSQAQWPTLVYWVASDFLRMLTLVALEWAWAQIEASASTANNAAVAAALKNWVLPEWDMRAAIMSRQLDAA